jgi:succinoglycan biosynthesis transport protein ExoP
MSLLQFLRILFARRSIILAALLSCFAVATVTAFLLPKTYTATSRLLLGQQDPLGEGVSAGDRGLSGFAQTQIEIIRDYRTAGRVVDALGWARDPAVIASYNDSVDPSQIDIRRWLAQNIIDNTEADLVMGTAIMEISYSASTPQEAAQTADLIRDAYLEENLRFRRSGAAKIADWFDEQANKALAQLRAAEKERNKFAQANNIVLDESNTDLESLKLRALTSESATAGLNQPVVVSGGGGVSQVDQLDAKIAQAAMSLGPNHPQMVAMRREREMVASSPVATTSGGTNVGAIESAFERQKAKVLSQSDKLDRLRQLQGEIDLRKDQYAKSTQRVAEFRLQSNVDNTGISPLADAVVPTVPSFPDVPMIMGGSIVVGLGFGVLLSLLTELMARRVRSADDLSYASGAPNFAIVGVSRKPDSATAKIVRFLDRKKRRREAEYYG